MSDPTGKNYDIYSTRLLKERIVMIAPQINDQVANVVTSQLLYLQFENKTKDISVYVNSPGGSVTAGLAIYDAMKFVKCEIATYVIGQAVGMALLIAAAGTRGKRLALRHARLMMTDLSGGAQATAKDIEIQREEIARLKKAVDDIFIEATGRTRREIEETRTEQRVFSPEQAFEFGLIDGIVDKPPQ